MRIDRLLKITSIILGFFALNPAIADIYDPGDNVNFSFAEAIENDELLRTPSIRETAQSVQKFNDEEVASESDQALENGLLSLKAILTYAGEELDRGNELERNLLSSIEGVLRQMSGVAEPNGLSRATNWGIDGDLFTVNLDAELPPLDFKTTYLDKISPSGDIDDQEEDIYKRAIDAVGILILTSQTMDYIQRKSNVAMIGALAKERVARWDAYFDKSIPQWPWELALVNGPIYANQIKNELGMARVPNWQLVVAHPDVALEYVDEAADGEQFKPSLIVEIIGANFWSWEKGGEQKGPWGLPIPIGIGLVATFSDRAGVDDRGVGGVIHLNHVYNVGATYRDGETGFFISLNVSKLFEDKRKKAEQYLDLAAGLR